MLSPNLPFRFLKMIWKQKHPKLSEKNYEFNFPTLPNNQFAILWLMFIVAEISPNKEGRTRETWDLYQRG